VITLPSSGFIFRKIWYCRQTGVEARQARFASLAGKISTQRTEARPWACLLTRGHEQYQHIGNICDAVPARMIPDAMQMKMARCPVMSGESSEGGPT
jgi:hypothetical protein